MWSRSPILATGVSEVVDHGESSLYRFLKGASPAAVAIAGLARLLREHGQRVLAGDEAIYAEARELRRKYTQRYMR